MKRCNKCGKYTEKLKRGMCITCYNRHYYESFKRKCKICGKPSKKGICPECEKEFEVYLKAKEKEEKNG